jgi:hypothetical protein
MLLKNPRYYWRFPIVPVRRMPPRFANLAAKERCESGRIGLTAKKSESPVLDRATLV